MEKENNMWTFILSIVVDIRGEAVPRRHLRPISECDERKVNGSYLTIAIDI